MGRSNALLLCLFLAGCGTPTVDIQTVCLPMADFTADQPELVKEWTQLQAEHPDWVTTRKFIPDTITLRDENRAACSKGTPAIRGNLY